MNFLSLMAVSISGPAASSDVGASHPPLPIFSPKWLRKNGDRTLLYAVLTRIGWANPETGEQVVSYKPGTFEALGVPDEIVAPNYKPNAGAGSFLDESGLLIPTVTVTADSLTVNWVAPLAGIDVTGYSVDVVDVTDSVNPVEIEYSPFAIDADTLTLTVTGLTQSTPYEVTVSYTNDDGTVDYETVTKTTGSVF